MTRFWSSRACLVALLASALGVQAQAAERDETHPPKHVTTGPAVQRLGGSGAWSAYFYHQKSGRVCYLAGGPQKSEPAKFKRKLPAAMVTHRPEENVANVVSFDAGTPLKEGSDASLEVDGTHFDLFTKGDTAWSRTSELDKTIVEAMAKGRQAVSQGDSAKGPADHRHLFLVRFHPDPDAD